MGRQRALRWVVTAGLATSVATLGVACGDDEAEADAGAYCDASLAIETAPEPEIDVEAATSEEQVAATKEHAGELLRRAEVLRRAAEDADVSSQVQRDIDAGMAAVRSVAETGDWEQAFTPELAATLDRLHQHDLDECGWQRVDVEMREYAFGAPTSIEAGVTSFEVANTGRESHQMLLFRMNDGVTESIEELLAMEEAEVEQKVTLISEVSADPGGSEYAVADLTSGRYAMVCFISAGTTPEHEGSGPPHAFEGMAHEITVG